MATATDMTVANTIRAQIGRSALFMLGASNFIGGNNYLTFRFKGSNKANAVKIILQPNDTYTLEFYKIRGTNAPVVKTTDHVYADGLNQAIEMFTGLYTSL